MQRRANAGLEDKKMTARKRESPLAEQSDDSIQVLESLSSTPATNPTSDRMDPFVNKQWLEESTEHESYRIIPSPSGVSNILEVWISQNVIRRYQACGRRGMVTNFRCATCDSFSFDATQPGRTITVKDGKVVGFLCPKHDIRCKPIAAPIAGVAPNEVHGSNGVQKKRRRLTPGDSDSVLSAPSDSPQYSQPQDLGQHEIPSHFEANGQTEFENPSGSHVDFESGLSYEGIRALQNSQIVVALQDIVGGITSLKDELSGIRGALDDLKGVFVGISQNHCNTANQ
ncbi:hypothetical protein L596_018668 [Steinernema carpocapsae]|nr:hypothetical protein L596_018668 [Steinernema carpocapsae]